MYTATNTTQDKQMLFPSTAQGNDIPNDLLSTLLSKASAQLEAKDYITQDEMEKLVASW